MTEVQEKIKVFAVCGPTASGKTSLSVTLAKKLHAEVVSCDSMQIYRGMEIGTAKPTADEMQGVPHHLMDFQDPAEPFSVSVAQQTMQDSRDFVKAAQNEALSQALSDAGFGIQLVSADTHAASVQKAAPVSKTQPSAITPPVSTVLPQEPSSASQKAAVLSEGNSVSGGTQTPQRASENAETARTKIQPAATPAHEQSLPVSPTTNTDTLPADSAPTTEQPENSKTAEELPIHLPAEELPVQRPAEDLTVAKEAQEVPEAKVVQEAPAYTPDMPVEDILKVMTLEQAQEVVVDSGVCRGLTIAEVAKKRPVNLRFYLTPGNKSKDNIVRAAAQLVLNSLQKAG